MTPPNSRSTRGPPGRASPEEARYGALEPAYATLAELRLPNGMYLASPSADYSKAWLRDTFYEVLPFVDKPTPHYEETYWTILDILRKHEGKLDAAIAEKPDDRDAHIHPRYHPETLDEFSESWGNKQHDAIGAVLFGVALGLSNGKRVLRDEKDRDLVQKLVRYLGSVRYWEDPDNGIWEEYEEVHASSIGACLAGLRAVSAHGFDVPEYILHAGRHALDDLLPRESATKKTDLALLSLIWPFNVGSPAQWRLIVRRVERDLLRERGVLRYRGDSYYSTKEKEHGRDKEWEFYHGSEAEWTMGLPWLALANRTLGRDARADYHLLKTHFAEIRPGSLPELYFAGTTKPNPNTPLGWAVALSIIAREQAGVPSPYADATSVDVESESAQSERATP